MRQIKFRGISMKHHDMIFGDLIHGAFCNGKITATAIKERGHIPHPVDPETVGQFTGFKDEQGAEIYEGDILECYSAIYLLSRHKGGCYELHEQGNDKVFFLFRNHSSLKILGNIHQHPNLLTNGK